MEKSMRRNKPFSLSLMIQGIRQTATLGICAVILTLLFSCTRPILCIIEQYNAFGASLTLSDFAMPILALWAFIPVFLVITLFGFMNKRNASDFYHSIPLNRICVYISYSAVVVFWGLISIISASFMSYFFYRLIPAYMFNLPFEFAKNTIFASVVAMLLSMSVTLLAKTLSGTDFANIVITALIMFTPRFFLMSLAESVISATRIATTTAIPFANPALNILIVPFVSGSYGTFDENITSPYTLIYSLVLAVIYYVVALFLYKIRKSEAAGKSSVYRGVQIAVRCVIGFWPIMLLCEQCLNGGIAYVDNYIWYETIGGSVILYFLYELLTTKSFKRLPRAIPAYFIVAAAGVAFLWGGTVCRDAILNDIPAVSEIESVSISSFLSVSLNIQEAQKYKFTDTELIEVLRSSLKENVDYIKTHNTSSAWELYNNYDSRYTIIFHTASGRELERCVFVDGQAQNLILNCVSEDEEYISAVASLPPDSDVQGISIYQYPDTVSAAYIYENENAFWESYKKEYNALTLEEKFDILQGSHQLDDFVAAFSITVYNNGGYYFVNLSVTKSNFPKTSALFMNES